MDEGKLLGARKERWDESTRHACQVQVNRPFSVDMTLMPCNVAFRGINLMCSLLGY